MLAAILAPVPPSALGLWGSKMERKRNGTMSSPVGHLFQALFAVGALLLAQTAVSTDIDWMGAIERLGLAVVLVVFFVYTSWQREQRMGKRIDQLERQAVSQNSKLAALTELVTEALKRDTEIVDDALKTLESRPCYAVTREQFEKWKADLAKLSQMNN